MLDRLRSMVSSIEPRQVLLIAGAGAALAVLVVLMRRLLRGQKPRGPRSRRADIDLSSLGSHGPIPSAHRFEISHIPMRLACVVMAPLGRGHHLPAATAVDDVLEQIIPGLGHVLNEQRAVVFLWPPQLSESGFYRSFFANAKLPGNRGKQSVWTAIAGRTTYQEQKLVLGLVACAADPNSLGEVTIATEREWFTWISVRES